MNSIVKRVIIGIAAVALLLAGFFGFTLFRFNAETKTMSPLATGVIADGVYAIKVKYVNMYIMKKGNDCIAFDAAQDPETVKQELSKIQIDPEAVKAVFLTHTDSDHAGALGLFKNAAVYISKQEEQMINGTTRRMFIFHNKAIKEYRAFDDGQVVEVGAIRVRCILTAGHTPGSASYLVDDSILFTGDTLSLKDGRVGIFSELFNMDSAAERISWTKIMDLPGVKYIFTAHHGYADDYRKAFEAMRKK